VEHQQGGLEHLGLVGEREFAQQLEINCPAAALIGVDLEAQALLALKLEYRYARSGVCPSEQNRQ
jgi:hypothetical protein